MTQFNQRKEPTFGAPSTDNTVTTTDNNASNAQAAPQDISLRTSQAPGFTFTPVMQPAPGSKAAASLPENNVSASQTSVAQPTVSATSAAATATATTAAAASTAKEESNVENQLNKSAASVEAASANSSAAQNSAQNATTAERVIPAAAASDKNWNKPDKWKALEKVPAKHRRLVVVVLLALILLGIFFWLKPSTPETVDEFAMQQTRNLPIEFRPVNEEEARAAEAQAAEEARLAQERALAEAQAAQQAVTQPAPAAPAATEPPAEAQQAAPAVVAPRPQASVIHRPEPAKAAPAPAKPAQAAPVKPATPKPQPASTKPVPAKPAETAKPAAVKPAPAKPAAPQPAPSAASGSSKALTVPAGVSLMQVFRNHNLNISDVNAMSKAQGGQVLSQLKAGDRVNVRLDGNNRVTEMTLSSGGKFVRKADGTYVFQK